MPHNTDDLRIREIKELTPPSHTMREFPCSESVADTVHESRQSLHRILHGMDDRLAVVIGPCSIHDTKAALEYAQEHGIDAVVQDPHKRKPNIRAGGYGENFAVNRRGTWTH